MGDEQTPGREMDVDTGGVPAAGCWVLSRGFSYPTLSNLDRAPSGSLRDVWMVCSPGTHVTPGQGDGSVV